MTGSPGIRVVHVVISLAPGGLERMVVDLANARNRRQPGSTLICCLDEAGELARQVEGDAVICMHANRARSPFDLLAVRKLRALLSEVRGQRTPNIGLRSEATGGRVERGTPNAEQRTRNQELLPTILHAHNMAAWQYGVLATIGTGVKLVYTQHGANLHNLGFVNRMRSQLLARFTDRIVAVSASTAQTMAEKQGISRDEIIVIPNGVPAGKGVSSVECRVLAPTTVASTFRVKLGIPLTAFVVGSVGRFSPEKNYPLLVRAFAAFRAACPNGFLVLVGDGPCRGEIEATLREYGVAGSCLLPGMQADVKPWLEAMDVFCLSSSTEGMSISLLEAGAVGLPSVVTDVGANSEIVSDHATGFVVGVGDHQALANALVTMCREPLLCARLGAEARRRVAERFSLDVALNTYEGIYAAA